MKNNPGDDPILASAKRQVETVRRDREALIQQIRQSQETIARSQALLARLDELLARLDPKPKP
jgi:uncharacterized membrane protein YccC